MANLVNYASFDEKSSQYHTNFIIDDKDKLDNVLQELMSNPNLLYRGMNNASYRLYTSAQRHFIWEDNFYIKFGGNFHQFVRRTIDAVKADGKVMSYFASNNIPVNDFLILALLQHYAECSPLLDFAYDIRSSLFFAQDKATPSTGENNIDDFISIYFTDNRIDWLRATIQEINKTGAERADEMVYEAQNKGVKICSSDSIEEMRNLTYEKYIDGISFLPVAGSNIGYTNVSMKHLGASWQYYITNPRLQQQKGLFIFNVSDVTPLAEQVNSVTKYYQLFGCINIHKNLIPHIVVNYLQPCGIDRNSVYLQTNKSRELEERIKQLLS